MTVWGQDWAETDWPERLEADTGTGTRTETGAEAARLGRRLGPKVGLRLRRTGTETNLERERD